MSNQDHTEQFPRKFGNYHLLKPLAQGGMGALYLAVRGDRGLERLLVIKTVLPHLADAEYTSRFRDEAKVVVKLSHGNLIPVFDAGSVDGELYLAMEFVEGRDLRAIWNRCAKKQVAFPVDVAVYIIKELCRGLGYAHSFGDLKLVHRDISPPNILVSYAGEVKITDFGLASSKLKLEKTAPGIIYGKVAYMSPEQARGEALDGRSDLYAGAIVLWELLTGRQLFPPGSDQPQDLLARARNPEPIPPSRKAPRVPPALDEICLRALAPLREDRYQNGDEFRKALSRWLAAEAPGTDSHRLESFLYDLFAEDVARERSERDELLSSIRKRAKTLPPSHELRQLIERDTDLTEMDPALLEPDAIDPKVMRADGSVGRRADDLGLPESDRRQAGDRRRSPSAGVDPAPDDDDITDDDFDQGNGKPTGQAMVGQIIDGRYRIIEILGEGGMGRVYRAEHVELDRAVAMKILHPVYSRMPELVERFRREARAASKIGNPHIVDVTDFGRTADGSAYFVMEYLEGTDLGSLIERHGAVDVRRVLHVGVQICRALAAAHASGIIHRDLKPDNIFLAEHRGESDFVKVLDFGVARTLELERARKRRLTSPGMAMGTPEYMSPEQAAGKPVDARSDIYSVGAIVYEALTGIMPYEGDNFMEVLTKKATTELPPASALRREVPPGLSELIERAMAREPDQRPATMEALEYELEKFLSGRGPAVASALGLRTDPFLADDLEPGPLTPPPATGRDLQRANAAHTMGGAKLDDTDSVRTLRTVPRWAVVGGVVAVVLLVFAVGSLLIMASSPGTSSAGRELRADDTENAAALVAGQGPHEAAGAAALADASAAHAAAPADAAVAMAAVDRPDADVPDPNGEPPDNGGNGESGDRPRKLSPAQMLKKADKLARARSWRAARELYDQVLAGACDRGLKRRATLGLAHVALHGEGKPKAAIELAEELLFANPGDHSAREFLARSYSRMGNHKTAARHYERLVKSTPRNARKFQSAWLEACKQARIACNPEG